MVTSAGFPNTGYCVSGGGGVGGSYPSGSVENYSYRCQASGGVPSGFVATCNGSSGNWCYFTAARYGACPTGYGVPNYPITGQCSAPATNPGVPDGTPSDYDCSYYTGKTYKQVDPWGAPSKVYDCSPSGCGLGAPSYDYTSSNFVMKTYTYTGQNCADHSKTPELTPDATKPTIVGTKTDSTVTNVYDNSTGAVTSTTTTNSTTTTTSQGGETQAIIDAVDGVTAAIGGLGGGSGASAGDIGDAVGDALTDEDNDDKLDVGDAAGDAEGQIGASEDMMDEFADSVGEGLGDATDGDGWSSTVGGLIPSYSCSDWTMTVHDISIELACADTALFRQILGWIVYAGTIVALFYLVTERPGGV